MFVKQSKKSGATITSAPSNIKHTMSAVASTNREGLLENTAAAIDNAVTPVSPPTSPVSNATPLQPAPIAPQTDEEAQQMAASHALATAKDILKKGGTQAEAAEGAKAVARQILREFQLAKMAKEHQQQQQLQQLQFAQAELVASLVSLQ
jgi:hypothetical protein